MRDRFKASVTYSVWLVPGMVMTVSGKEKRRFVAGRIQTV